MRETPPSTRPSLLLRCGAFFFLILFSYFLLRSVREAMGVQRGMGDLRWLFVATLVAMGVVNLLFGKVVGVIARRAVVPAVFGTAIACLVAFAATLALSDERVRLGTGYAFYVWLSVFNLFAVSVFWIVLLDLFPLEQARRLFPVVGMGGTLGAFAGSATTTWLATSGGELLTSSGFDPDRSLAPLVIGASVIGLGLAASLGTSVHRDALSRGGQTPDESRSGAVPGPAWSGLADVMRSPYLVMAAAYVLLLAVSSTVLYFVQAEIVSGESESLQARIGMFSRIDLATQGLTLVLQAFVTAQLLRRLGTGLTLLVLPLVTLIGLVMLWIEPAYGTLLVVQSVHRAGRYAVARPARETLFSILPESQRYKAKSLIDTFVYRAGDVTGVLFMGLSTLGAVLLIVAPLAAAWGMLALALGAAQHKRARTISRPPDEGRGGTPCPETRTLNHG